ncbi:MAG: hypothetical protein WA906_13425, partial [Pacificimonas sp.]
MRETIISYRGTDSQNAANWRDKLADVTSGWSVGGGSPYAEQAGLAVEFYKAVTDAEGTDLRLQNVSFTGHSMGGGFAGLLASVYDKPATVFANMAFEAAAENTYSNAQDLQFPSSPTGIANAELRERVYGTDEPWA